MTGAGLGELARLPVDGVHHKPAVTGVVAVDPLLSQYLEPEFLNDFAHFLVRQLRRWQWGSTQTEALRYNMYIPYAVDSRLLRSP